MTDAGSVLALVKDAATLTHEAHFCTLARKMGYREEVPAQVGDIQDVLWDGLFMMIASIYVDKDLPVAHCRDAAVISQNNLNGFREGGEGFEPMAVRAHDSRSSGIDKPCGC